jgi:chaperonin cofactor prefoldin
MNLATLWNRFVNQSEQETLEFTIKELEKQKRIIDTQLSVLRFKLAIVKNS